MSELREADAGAARRARVNVLGLRRGDSLVTNRRRQRVARVEAKRPTDDGVVITYSATANHNSLDEVTRLLAELVARQRAREAS